MNLTAVTAKKFNTVYPSSSNYFLSCHGEVLRFVLSRVFYSAFLPEQTKITCAEKRLNTLGRRGGYAPKTGNDLRDSISVFGSAQAFTFGLEISHLTTFNLSGLCRFSFGAKRLTTVFWFGS